jgi:hypothetical protein
VKTEIEDDKTNFSFMDQNKPKNSKSNQINNKSGDDLRKMLEQNNPSLINENKKF